MSFKQIIVHLAYQLFLPIKKLIFQEQMHVFFKETILEKDRKVNYSNQNYSVLPMKFLKAFTWLELYKKEHRLNNAAFYEANSMTILYPSGVFITKDKKAVMASVKNRVDYLKKSGAINYFLPFKPKSKNRKEIDLAISFMDPLDQNYFHFINDVLSFFDCYERYIHDNEQKPKVIIRGNKTSFQYQWLLLLDVPEIDIVFFENELFIHSLIIPNIRTTKIEYENKKESTFLLDPKSYHFLKTKVEAKLIQHTPKRKLFISRAKSDLRNIHQEDILFQKLKEVGFEKIYLEDLDVLDQLQCVYNASHIIMAHGAGLTNIFIAENCQIIELFPKGRYTDCASIYYQITSLFKNEYTLLVCPVIDSKETMVVDTKILFDILTPKKNATL